MCVWVCKREQFAHYIVQRRFNAKKNNRLLKKWLSISICGVFPYLNHILKDTTNVQLNEINSVQGLALGINTNALSVLLIIQVAVHSE